MKVGCKKENFSYYNTFYSLSLIHEDFDVLSTFNGTATPFYVQFLLFLTEDCKETTVTLTTTESLGPESKQSITEIQMCT